MKIDSNSRLLIRKPLAVYIATLLIYLIICSCKKEPEIIVPPTGYDWPEKERPFWPTDSWQDADMKAHHIDPSLMEIANDFAAADPLSRALLVVKDGYLVYEKYYGAAGPNQSTNLWSVTKSFTSALVGLLVADGYINSTNQLMAELMPQYPDFMDITLHHTLTHTTGLSWIEYGPLWTQWALSEDWVQSALDRGQVNPAGKKFFYSSANSHFLTALAYHKTGLAPVQMMKERIFDPLGIPFQVFEQDMEYTNWDQYKEPAFQTWRKDPQGIECASFGLYLRARDMAKFGYLYLNKGYWDGDQLISESWIENSTKDQVTDVYDRYSYGYQWYLTYVGGHPAFLASGFGGQIIGVVPSIDMVVVLKYEAEDPKHPVTGSEHDDMYLFELVVNAVKK